MKKPKRIEIFKVPIDCLTMDETLAWVNYSIENKSQLSHAAVNAGKVVKMLKDPVLYQSVISADIISPDGMVIVWVSKLFRKALPERVSGIDLMENVMKLAFERNYKVFFFGATEDVVVKVVNIYREKYTDKVIAGYRNGYFKLEESQDIAKQINSSGANILLVAITSPLKENFLYQHKDFLSDVNFIMGVGGSFDVVSGKLARAPIWMQNNGLEWLFRWIQEPRRLFDRYFFGNLKFLSIIIKELFNQNKPPKP